MEREVSNWSETLEDLIDDAGRGGGGGGGDGDGDIDKAISHIQSVILKLEALNPPSQSNQLQLSTALFDLAKLYSAKGFSLKADEIRSRALLVKQQSNNTPSPQNDLKTVKQSEEGRVSQNEEASVATVEKSSTLLGEALLIERSSDDDWEAVADRAPDELLSPQSLPSVSELSLEDTKVTPKRRGRGTFSYKKRGLYSDQKPDGHIIDDSEEDVCNSSVPSGHSGDAEIRDLKYGTRHVLVLDGFPPSFRTTDLEKLLADFKDRGVAIRWVNDTVALAVFRTPSIALEASNCMQCPFTVRVLDENDELLSSISPRDLEPPRQRPQTSARTANRLIANVMGLKLPSTSFGSNELRKQEAARKNRIVSRQNMRDDAWGDADDVN